MKRDAFMCAVVDLCQSKLISIPVYCTKLQEAIRKVCIFQGEVGLQNSIFVKLWKGSLPPKYSYRFISISEEGL